MIRNFLLGFVVWLTLLGGNFADAGSLRLRLHPQYMPYSALMTPEASLTYAAGSLSASPTFVFYLEWRCAQGTTTNISPLKFESCLNSILAGNFADVACGGATNAESTPGLNFVNETPSLTGKFRFNMNNSTCGANNSSTPTYTGTNVLNGGWHSLLWYGDVTCSSATNTRCGRVYLDGVQVVDGFADNGAGGWTGTKTVAFNVNTFMMNAWDSTGASPQVATRVEYGRFFLDLNAASSPVVGSTNAPNFTLGNFGTAVSPRDWGPTCSFPLSHQPTICHANPPASYLTNLGSGPQPTITAAAATASTVNNKFYAASSRPGEVPDRPWVRWTYSYVFKTDCPATALTCTQGTNIGNPIVQPGDLICAQINITSSGTSTYNNGYSVSGGPVTSWSDKLGGTKANNNFDNVAMWCGVATTSVAAGSDMASPTFTWTNNSGAYAGGFSANITMIDFGVYGPANTTPTVVTAAATDNTVAVNTLPCPSVTATAGLSLWICTHSTFDWSFGTPAGNGPPLTSTLFQKLTNNTSGNAPMIEFEKIGSAGAISRSGQVTSLSGNKALSVAMVLQ